MFSTCNNDEALGPGVFGCRSNFDFTVLFELIFFSIIPSAAFIPSSIWRSVTLVRKPTVVDAPILQLIKLGALAAYAGLQLSLVVSVGVGSFHETKLSIGSTVLQFAAALCMIVLSYLDHSRSPRPSLLLGAYLFLTLLFDIAETRTFWLASNTRPEVTFTSIFTATLVLKVFLLLLESKHKTKWVNWDNKDPHSPEETNGVFGLGVYSWLNSLFIDGYRNVLRIEDLYPLDHAMKGEILHQQFQSQLDLTKLRTDRHGLVKAVARALRGPLILPIVPRLLRSAFLFCQPFFINSLLNYLSGNGTGDAADGYGFIGAGVLIYAGLAISTAIYQYLHHRMLQMARGCLVTAIFSKTTEAQFNSGEESEAITLMSIDIERMRNGFLDLHEAWAAVLEVAAASCLLYFQIGPAFIAPIVVMVCCSMAISWQVKRAGSSQNKWMAAVQRRVGLTSAVIAGMKNLKISGLSTPVSEFIQDLRVEELAASGQFRKVNISSAFIAFLPTFLSPVITFAVAQRSLDTTEIFTALSYLILLSTPLQILFQSIPHLFASLACTTRIGKFLASESREDFRQVLLDVKVEVAQEDFTDKDVTPNTQSAISVINGSFGWEVGKMILSNINAEIPKNSLTIICGPIACGKSTLCKSLLGEVAFRTGDITMHVPISRVAYCDQTPVLSNGTIRDNIIGFSALDSSRFSEVISATMLNLDLATMPDGDLTIIGSNGITLSGGQKQRVALARALYLPTDLLILDDVFSGLDADTEEEVFRRVFGPDGLIKRRNATAVLCTHSVRHLPAADHIIALGSRGEVVEQGAFDNLMGKESGYIQTLGLSTAELTDHSKPNESSEATDDSEPELTRRATAVSTTSDMDRSRQLGTWKVYGHYLNSMGHLLTVTIFLSGLVFGFGYNFRTIWLKYWSDDSATQFPSHSFAYYIGIYALLNGGTLLVLAGFAVAVMVFSVIKAGANLHHEALQTLFRAPLRFFTTTDQGQIVNLFSQDFNLIDTELPNAVLNAMFSIFATAGQAAILATTSPYLALCYPFLAALLWVIQKFYLRTSRQMRLLDLEAKSPLYTHFMDTAKGIVTYRASGYIRNEKEKNVHLLDTSQRPAYLLQMIQNWLSLVLNLVVMVLAAILVSLAVKLRSSSGFTGASLVTLMSFGESLSGIVLEMTRLETSMGAIARLISFKSTVLPEDKDEEDFAPEETWPHDGRIEFKGVSATYDVDDTCNTDKSPNLALRDITLSVQPAEKVAFCGRTGSGKSSLIALLLKLLDPLPTTAPDAIMIDDHALSRIDRGALRRRLISVPQDAVFLPDGSSFRANLDAFGAADSDDCRSVLEAVDLWAFVEDRGGLEAGMSPGTLSGGQKQLFSLARAVLRRRLRSRAVGKMGTGASEGGILLLDEVSSSVDLETEKAMFQVIRREFESYTVLAISHRLDMILDFDRVVVMDRGQIVEAGKPVDLIAASGTRFGELWRVAGNRDREQ